MSEGNERNLEGIAPEAAENIKEQGAEATETAAQTPDLDDRENAPGARDEAPAKPKKSKKKAKKRKRSSVIVPLAIILAVLLVVFGVLVGFGLSRVRSERGNYEQADAQSGDIFADGVNAIDEIAPFNEFEEEQTGENQQALDALSGDTGFFDEGASALMGEDGLFGEELSDELAAEPVVVAEFGDGQQLMSDEVLAEYSDQMSVYILSGYSEAELAETLLDDVLRSMVSQRVLEAHAREMGLFELNEEDEAAIAAQAQEIYGEYLTFYRDSAGSTEGMTEEEITAAAESYLRDDMGITYESIRAELEAGWWEQKIYDEIASAVTVDDAAVEAAYEERLADQKETFVDYPADYEFSQMNGELIVYNLPGYRAVKMLLVGFDDLDTEMRVYALTDDLADAEGASAAQAQENLEELNTYYAGPEARAAEALEQLRAGANMDEMILSMGADEGMMDERQRAMGYYVSADSVMWSEAFVSAAMALENVGDYSGLVRIPEGVCILQYLGEVPEGEVPLEDVREALAEETLEVARSEAYERQILTWLEEANPRYYPERMQ